MKRSPREMHALCHKHIDAYIDELAEPEALDQLQALGQLILAIGIGMGRMSSPGKAVLILGTIMRELAKGTGHVVEVIPITGTRTKQ